MNEKEFIKYKSDELKLSLKLFPGDFIKDTVSAVFKLLNLVRY